MTFSIFWSGNGDRGVQ